MYFSLPRFLLSLCVLCASFPLLAKHKSAFKKIEPYCATNAWVFPVYEDLDDKDNTGKFFIPFISSPHHKYPLIVDIGDPRDGNNAVSSMLRKVLINRVFLGKESIELAFEEGLNKVSKESFAEKSKSSHLRGLIVLDCVAERASQNASINTDYAFIPRTSLEQRFVSTLPYVNFLNARSTEKRFAQSDLCYAIEFLNVDRTEQDALISAFNTFLFEHLRGLKRSSETNFKDEL